MQTTEEVYFLVRVGTWGPEDLDKWIQLKVDNALYGDEEEIDEDNEEEIDEDNEEEFE